MPANPFDDMVMVLTANDLLSPLINSGTLKDYRSTLNNTFQIMRTAAISFAVNTRIGDPASRQYSLPDNTGFPALLSVSQRTDPWGTIIVYAGNDSINPVTSGTPGGNLAITLTSYGPDKVLGGGDDIVQTIYVADLKNIFQLSGW